MQNLPAALWEDKNMVKWSFIAKVGKGSRDLYPPAKVKTLDSPINVSLLLECRVKNHHWTSEGLKSTMTLGVAQWWNIARHAHCPGFHPQHYTDTLEYAHICTYTCTHTHACSFSPVLISSSTYSPAADLE